MSTTAKKVTVKHPVSGNERKFDASIYEPFKAAIVQSLKGTKGITFSELTNRVTPLIKEKMPGFKGSIPWYTISVRLDLEARGIVESYTEGSKKLNRLKR